MFAVCLNYTLLVLCVQMPRILAVSGPLPLSLSLSLLLSPFLLPHILVSPLPVLPAPGKNFRPVRLKMYWHFVPTFLNMENIVITRSTSCAFLNSRNFFSNLLTEERIVQEKLSL
jgi:hypothetical protein